MQQQHSHTIDMAIRSNGNITNTIDQVIRSNNNIAILYVRPLEATAT